MSIFTILLIAVIGGVIGIFVYRNNEKLLSKYADKLDDKWDNMEHRIDELKKEIRDKKR